MLKIEHIGIAVRNLQEAIPVFEKILQTPCYKKEIVASENVVTAFFATGGTKIELLESTSPEGVIARFIGKKGEGVHHIAFAVEDIQKEMERMRSEGIRLLNDVPREGADDKLICFLHPGDTGGVLVELCMAKK
jgi:methylmalonyl-CoA/ethylmalonyl-CoA epimerase